MRAPNSGERVVSFAPLALVFGVAENHTENLCWALYGTWKSSAKRT
jgi:hypothetical protein